MPYIARPLATPFLDLPPTFDLTPLLTPDGTETNLIDQHHHSFFENNRFFAAALRLNQLFAPLTLQSNHSPPSAANAIGNKNLLSPHFETSQPNPIAHTRPSHCTIQPISSQFHLTHRAHDNSQHPRAAKMQITDYLRKFEHLFMVTPQRMRMIVESFIDILEAGLKEEDQGVHMIPTFVFGRPNGKEIGPYLAVDLGDTSLRVCRIELKGNSRFEIIQAKYELTEEQKQQEGEKLFDFCANCLSKFVYDQFVGHDGNLSLDEDIPLGLAFSYHCLRKRTDHGELIRWTKEFGNPNVEGQDVGQIFTKSLKKYNVPVKLTALINDTIGTLIASSYVDPATRIGAIFGAGCNAAYMEKVVNIPKIAYLGLPPDTEVAINFGFDSATHEHLPRTKYDLLIDETSKNPGGQAFEKMIAGHYLGEVFRLIAVELIKDGILFLGQNTYKIEKSYCFDTAFLSLIESDSTEELSTVTDLFTRLFGLNTTISERQLFRRLAELIGTRSARLSACGIASIVSKMGYLETGCGVATKGSQFSKYPQFAQRLQEALVDIFGEKGRLIKTYPAEDGSGVGSAIIAAMTRTRLAEGKFTHV